MKYKRREIIEFDNIEIADSSKQIASTSKQTAPASPLSKERTDPYINQMQTADHVTPARPSTEQTGTRNGTEREEESEKLR